MNAFSLFFSVKGLISVKLSEFFFIITTDPIKEYFVFLIYIKLFLLKNNIF